MFSRFQPLPRLWIAPLAIVFAVWNGSAASAVDFFRQVQPLLAEQCSKCHGDGKQEGGLRLDQGPAVLKGGESGPAVIPGDPNASLIFQRMTAADASQRMPPEGPGLSPEQTEILREWIASGARWPEDPIAELAANHWAFQPPQRATPAGASSALASHPVDGWVDAGLRRAGLDWNPPASRQTLLRRVTLDLTGLPPSEQESVDFIADQSPDAYEKVVDRLLGSRDYAVRMARYWLDLARWAESDGYEANDLRPAAWRYRDYVIGAFERDLPYDVFLRQQIAGDELIPFREEHLIATGFLAATRTNNNEEDRAVQLNEPLIDIANTTASIAIGLTLSCAQCHDHKFEPLTIRDYYAWHGFFVRGQTNRFPTSNEEENARWRAEYPPEYLTAKTLFEQLRGVAERAARAASGAGPDAEVPPDLIERHMPDADRKLYDELKQKIERIDREQLDRRPHIWAFSSPVNDQAPAPLPTRGQYPFSYDPERLKTIQPHVYFRGDVHRPSEPVVPDVPAVLRVSTADHTPPRSRTELAEWLASERNPLTARVWANHLWQFHFGRGLVETPGDFGVRGAPPSHPELLDQLAIELRESGWSSRHVHRLIVTSRAYRQSAETSAMARKIDPDNRWLGRWRPRRFDGEGIRDSLLAVAGTLERHAQGPSDGDVDASNRRSLCLTQKRYAMPDTLAVFDAPTANEFCPRRHVSTVPLQPLHLLNHPRYLKLAESLADRISAENHPDSEAIVARAMILALGRSPDADELRLLASGLREIEAASDRRHALKLICQAILNLNEFAYIP